MLDETISCPSRRSVKTVADNLVFPKSRIASRDVILPYIFRYSNSLVLCVAFAIAICIVRFARVIHSIRLDFATPSNLACYIALGHILNGVIRVLNVKDH